jgi:hypothetical protein
MSRAAGLVATLVDAYNQRELHRAASLYAPDARVHPAGWDDDVDVPTWHAAFEMVLTSFPELTITPEHVASGEGVVIIEARLTGSNSGPLHLGDLDRLILATDVDRLPPTGRAMDIIGTVVFQVAGNRVAAERHYWKTADTLVQLGLVEIKQTPSA